MTGHLILLIAVTGGGKRVLRDYIRGTFPQIKFAVSCTTRAQRPEEMEGRNYFFISKAEFQKNIEEGAFLEWIEQDGGHLYGTLKSEVLQPLLRGEVVLREVEVKGVHAIRELVPKEHLTVLFIQADGWDVLKRRIEERAPISAEELEGRRLRYEQERLFGPEADVIVENRDGELDAAKRDMKAAIQQILDNVCHTAQT